jgi:hypothetical protein
MAKNARRLELGPANIYLYLLPRASLTFDSYPYDSPNGDVYMQAYKGGNLSPDRPGNSIRVAFVNDGASRLNLTPARHHRPPGDRRYARSSAG